MEHAGDTAWKNPNFKPSYFSALPQSLQKLYGVFRTITIYLYVTATVTTVLKASFD